jgi:hypothetical protein
MCKQQFLKYFSEESCKSCSSIQKADKCLQFDECSSMEFEYFKAGYSTRQEEVEEILQKVLERLYEIQGQSIFNIDNNDIIMLIE